MTAKNQNKIGAWILRESREIPERNLIAHLYEHERLGSRYLHLENEDENKVFCVAFKTIPEDDSGAPHILEHTVLTGSRKYPVRDPFFSMLKRSLQSFMNAFTSEDWTAYPFAAWNDKDFFNLLDIYLDASFFPTLDRYNFLQEGHRLEKRDGRWIRQGVVYNEMKGALSSPDRIMAEAVKKNLFPKSSYRFNSGGDPAAISNLSHEQLLAFHRRYYHPGNAWFYSYGKMDIAAVLLKIEQEVLERFEALVIDTEIKPEPRWTQSRSLEVGFPYTGEEPERRHQYSLNWLVADVADGMEIDALGILEDLLLGHPGAPLRQALMESGLGSSLSDGTGLDTDLRTSVFRIGLKDVRHEDYGRIKEIILGKLSELAEKGFDPEAVAASLRREEFDQREVSNSPYPYGLSLWMDIAESWLHGISPFTDLSFRERLEKLKAGAAQGIFSDLIKKYFLENSHCLELSMVPDKEMLERQEQSEGRAIEEIAALMSPVEAAGHEADSQELIKRQSAGEDLSCLPSLEIRDLKDGIKKVDWEKKDNSLMLIPEPTNGLFYLGRSYRLPAGDIDPSSLAPLAFLLTRCGTKRKAYTELAEAIQRNSGGIGAGVFAKTAYDSPKTIARLNIQAKCLSSDIAGMMGLLEEIVHEYDFSDREVVGRFLREYQAAFEQEIVEHGHFFAMSAAARHFSQANFLNELWQGVSQLRYLKETPDLGKDLERTATAVLTAPVLSAFIAERADIDTALSNEKPENGQGTLNGNLSIDCGGKLSKELYVLDSDVSFTAAAFALPRLTHADAPALLVLSKLIGRGYIHNEIREKGGAYGGYVRYDYEEGVWLFASYRDPRVLRTLETYGSALDYGRKHLFSQEEVKDAIIMCMADIDRPDSPAEAGYKAFGRELVSLSDEMRQQFKGDILKLKASNLQVAADRHFPSAWTDLSVAILTNERKAESVRARQAGIFSEQRI